VEGEKEIENQVVGYFDFKAALTDRNTTARTPAIIKKYLRLMSNSK
jgi:hypothetical protein